MQHIHLKYLYRLFSYELSKQLLKLLFEKKILYFLWFFTFGSVHIIFAKSQISSLSRKKCIYTIENIKATFSNQVLYAFFNFYLKCSLMSLIFFPLGKLQKKLHSCSLCEYKTHHLGHMKRHVNSQEALHMRNVWKSILRKIKTQETPNFPHWGGGEP